MVSPAVVQRDVDAQEFYTEINAWTPAKAWYAIHHVFTALIPFVAADAKKIAHDLTTTEATKLTVDRKLFPPPFSSWVKGAPPDVTYFGFPTTPEPLSNLADPRTTPFRDQLALILRSTAAERVEQLRKKWLRANPGRKRLSPGKRAGFASSIKATTIFHFMYRLRLRVNYDDADTFVLGAPYDGKAQWFAQNLLIVTDALMVVTEALIGEYVGREAVRKMAEDYATKRGCDESDPLGRRRTYLG